MLNRPPNAPRIVTGPQPAIRLKFRYEGDQVTLAGRRRLEKTLPPSDPVDDRKPNLSGFWFEVQGKGNEPLYRRGGESPIATSVEIPTGDPERPYSRQDIANPQGTFYVLVPDLPNAQDVVLFSSPIAPGEARKSLEPATELARVPLRDDAGPYDDHGKERAS